MKSFSLSLMLLGLASSYAIAGEVCGKINKYSKGSDGPYYRVEFTDKRELSNIILTLGEQALFAVSMANEITICFKDEQDQYYRIFSASK